MPNAEKVNDYFEVHADDNDGTYLGTVVPSEQGGWWPSCGHREEVCHWQECDDVTHDCMAETGDPMAAANALEAHWHATH